MIEREKISNHLADFLKINEFDDYCVNGIQVEGTVDIERVLFGVSVSQKLFQLAVDETAQMIVVHHGLFWRGSRQPFQLTGIMKIRVKMLLDNNINLLAYHLPLDAHPEVGNNAMLLKKMNLPASEPFEVGYISRLESAISPVDLKNRLDSCLPDPSTVFGDIEGPVKNIAVVSGGAAGLLEKAWLNGADALISGEASEPGVRLAEEMGVCFLNAGHCNSERLGPMALKEYIESSFDLDCTFVDVPNPM